MTRYPTPNLDYAHDVLQRHMTSRQEHLSSPTVITAALADHEQETVEVTWHSPPVRSTKIHHAVITFAQWDYHQKQILSNK